MSREATTGMTGDATKGLAGEIPGKTSDPAPYFRAHVFVCGNQRPAGHPRGCCHDKGSEELRNYMKARAKELGLFDVRINQAGCLERCEVGPTMVIYPEGVWYRPHSTADVEEILQTHVVGGGRVARLMLTPEDGPPLKRPSQKTPDPKNP